LCCKLIKPLHLTGRGGIGRRPGRRLSSGGDAAVDVCLSSHAPWSAAVIACRPKSPQGAAGALYDTARALFGRNEVARGERGGEGFWAHEGCKRRPAAASAATARLAAATVVGAGPSRALARLQSSSLTAACV